MQLAVELDAASADHVTHVTDDDVDALANSDTVATLLPGAEFSTRARYPDARRLIDAGVTVALAADCNPGSSYTTNIPFCIAIAVREMGMTTDEAVWAATKGGALALRRDGRRSSRAGCPRRRDPARCSEPYPSGVPSRRPARRRGVPRRRASRPRSRWPWPRPASEAASEAVIAVLTARTLSLFMRASFAGSGYAPVMSR